MSHNYAVISPVPAVGDPCWNDVDQSFSTARRSIDETKCILKWHHGMPSGLNAITVYSHSGILQYLEDNYVDWDSGD